tara:strand:- start:299 stop:634 length:336 start_codon:yes stop_codon:yes gene_type:complete
MTWRETECEDCGNYVTYGMYFSEHEHDDTEITVTIRCGYCVTGTTEEEEEQIYEEPLDAEHLLNNAFLDDVEDEKIRGALQLTRDLYDKYPENKDIYARTFATLWRGVVKT